MSELATIYCLDANVLIQAWQKYYSPLLCPGYWDMLNHLGRQGRVFLPRAIYDEIMKVEDDLASWVKTCSIPIKPYDESVTRCLQQIYSADAAHEYLVDNVKYRSMADPWVIAHALNGKAAVVTKEEKITGANRTKIKIPNVCENMGIRYLTDFEMLAELSVSFTCQSQSLHEEPDV